MANRSETTSKNGNAAPKVSCRHVRKVFGDTSMQKLFKVQLPLAKRSIMMVLAMVIIAELVGGGALGLEAVTGHAKSQVGRGIEAGLAIVILAMILDRLTQAWADSEPADNRNAQ